MPRLTPAIIEQNINEINEPEMQKLRNEDIRRDWIYHGKILEVVYEAILREFKKPETIVELKNRMIPINIVQKIINKLAMVYKSAPMRKAADGNEDDNELIQIYEDGLNINRCMKSANRHFKLYKRALVEMYLGEKGVPSMRALRRGTYEVFSSSAIDPQIPDTVLKILKWDHDETKRVFEWWTDQDFLITNGKGVPLRFQMEEMGNPTGVNPYGVLPFQYINESDTDLIPLPDDDLLKVGIAIPLLLSDVAFASKYQAWSMIYTVGVDGDIPINPNSVVNLEFGPQGERPEINTIKPDIDTESQLRFVEAVVAFLLSTKNLNAGSIQGKLTTQNAASGIAKMLDNAESMEDREDQQQYFIDAEKEIWEKLAHKMIPYWRQKRLLDGDFNAEFSKEFELSIHFPEIKIIKTEMERLNESLFRIEKGFSTLKRELKKLYPDASEDELDALIDEINQEKMDKLKLVADSMQPMDGDVDENDSEETEE